MNIKIRDLMEICGNICVYYVRTKEMSKYQTSYWFDGVEVIRPGNSDIYVHVVSIDFDMQKMIIGADSINELIEKSILS